LSVCYLCNSACPFAIAFRDGEDVLIVLNEEAVTRSVALVLLLHMWVRHVDEVEREQSSPGKTCNECGSVRTVAMSGQSKMDTCKE
jgi:hypothetical protein